MLNTSTAHSNMGFRINHELQQAKQLLEALPPAVTIYGGSRVRADDPYYVQTVQLAKIISRAGIPVISGGGPGIMEAANRGAKLGVNGLSVGLKITLPFEEVPNPHQDISVQFSCFAARKVAFCKYSGAFIVMPGGVGTLDELFEVLTLIQTGKMPTIPVMLFGADFWSGLVAWLKNAVLARGLISAVDLERRIQMVNSIDTALEIVAAAYPAAAMRRVPRS